MPGRPKVCLMVGWPNVFIWLEGQDSCSWQEGQLCSYGWKAKICSYYRKAESLIWLEDQDFASWQEGQITFYNLRAKILQKGPIFHATLKVPSHEFFFFHNKFAFGEYNHVHSAVLKVWFVKYSQITKFTLKITL